MKLAAAEFPECRREMIGLLMAFIILAFGICGYSLWTGPIAFMGDSYLFTDRAKHLFYSGNLDLTNHSGLIYPPLYSITIAPFYALRDPFLIIRGITLLNSLLVASAVFPIYLLIRDYARASGVERWLVTFLVAASPTLVAYAPMVLSEALFIPLVFWTTYAMFRSIQQPKSFWFITAGLLMAIGLLTRSAAASLFLAGFTAWALHLLTLHPSQRVQTLRSLVLAAVAFSLPLVAWHLFERRSVVYHGNAEYSISNSLRALAASRPDQLIKLQWTGNAILYFITAPLNIGAFLALLLLVQTPKIAWRDPVILFVVGLIALSIASIVILASTTYGGGLLTWNKYFAPFVGLLTVVALRVRENFTIKHILIVLGIALLFPWFGLPSRLACHFPDALTPYINTARPLPLQPWGRDWLFFLLFVITAPIWLGTGRPIVRYLAAGIGIGGSLFSNTAAGQYWRDSGLLNFSHYTGLGARLVEQRRPKLPIYYDPEIAQKDAGEALRCLFYFPTLIPQLSRASLFAENATLPDNFLYITRVMLPSATLLTTDSEDLRLFHVNGSLVKRSFDYRFQYQAGVGGQEAITFDGKPSLVRWLGEKAEMTLHIKQPIEHVSLGFRLGASGQSRKAILTLNGQRMPQEIEVSHVLWSGGFDFVTWEVSLRGGDNQLILENDSPTLTLPDGGRKVTFLLIDEPVLLKP